MASTCDATTCETPMANASSKLNEVIWQTTNRRCSCRRSTHPQRFGLDDREANSGGSRRLAAAYPQSNRHAYARGWRMRSSAWRSIAAAAEHRGVSTPCLRPPENPAIIKPCVSHIFEPNWPFRPGAGAARPPSPRCYRLRRVHRRSRPRRVAKSRAIRTKSGCMCGYRQRLHGMHPI